MATTTKAKKRTAKEMVVDTFRFSHRAHMTYSSLLVHYRDTFHLPHRCWSA